MKLPFNIIKYLIILSSMNNKEKGDIYEKFIHEYLLEQEFTNECYLYKDVPDKFLFNNGLIKSSTEIAKYNENKKSPEVGIDILYTNNNEDCIIVQCKNYTNTIYIDDLSGFYASLFNYNKTGELYYTSKLSHKIMVENEKINFHRKQLVKLKKVSNIIKPYIWQREIIKACIEFYKNNSTGILCLPCGTGKTLISINLILEYKYVIIFTPYKAYCEQNKKRIEEYTNTKNCLIVDSEGTRDIEVIEKYINDNEHVILCATYKSADILSEIINKKDFFVIFDE